MATQHLEIPTLASAVNNLPTLMDDQTDLLDQALQGDVDFVVTAGGTIVIGKTIGLRNFMFNLTGTPSAAFNVDFPINNRYFAVNNKSGETATIRIDGGGGTTVTVVDSEQRIIYIDGTDVIDITGIGVPNLETLVTLSSDFTISSTTLTAIDWGAETRDEGSWWAVSPDPEQIKIGAGIVDAQAKIHVINFTADETLTCKLQRYNSSDSLQETLFEENREHDGSLDLIFNFTVLNIRTAAGDYLTIELKSVVDTSYDVEDADSYFLVRRSTTGGASSGSVIFSGARAKRITSTFAVANALASLSIDFNGEDFDTDSYHDNSTNPSRMTIPSGVADAYYDIKAGFETAAYSSGHVIQIWIAVNGEDYAGKATRYIATLAGTFSKGGGLSTTLILSADDYVELRMRHNHTGDVDIDANDASFLSIERLGFV